MVWQQLLTILIKAHCTYIIIWILITDNTPPQVIYTVWYIPFYDFCNEGMLGMLLISCSEDISACTSLYPSRVIKLLHRSGGLNRMASNSFNNELYCLSASLRGGNFQYFLLAMIYITCTIIKYIYIATRKSFDIFSFAKLLISIGISFIHQCEILPMLR